MTEFIYNVGYALSIALLGLVTFAICVYAFAIGRVWILHPLQRVLRRIVLKCRSKVSDLRWWVKRNWWK